MHLVAVHQKAYSLHGSLAQCNKLKNKKMGLRVIFREIQGKFEVIQVVVIGKRDPR